MIVRFGLVSLFLISIPACAQETLRPDRALHDGGHVLANGWSITPAGRVVELPGDMPMRMLLSPDNKFLAVNTAGYHDHGVYLIDLATEKLVQKIPLTKTWAGMCWNPAGNELYVSGGFPWSGATSTGTPILSFSYDGRQLKPGKSIDWPELTHDKTVIAGLAYGPDQSLYALNLESDTVFSLRNRKLAASQKVGDRPYGVALSPDRKLLAISNWGDESITFLDTATLKESARIKVQNHPNDLVYGFDGRLYVANAGANSVSVIDNQKLSETLKTSIDPKAPVGSTPIAVIVSPDDKRLYVANADNNNVAVFDISQRGESRPLGFIPTGWYPSALAVSKDGRKLYVGVGKGMRSKPNAEGTYIGTTLSGWVEVIDLPDADGLAKYTEQARRNIPTGRDDSLTEGKTREVLATMKKIKHVLYIIRENRTYDQVFGDIKEGNGDPKLCMFGQTVTPNAHALARDYVLLDNLYCDGEVSVDGHQWCNAAYATDFNEKSWEASYSKHGKLSSDEKMNASPTGYLWDNCARHGLTYRSYGEMGNFKSSPDLEPQFDLAKAPKDTTVPKWDGRDPERAKIFVNELKEAEKTGKWPTFMVMSLPEDHTRALSAGAHTPKAMVASNDQAIGQIVEAVTHSKFWPETAIFIIEDDAQNGHDHVDAHRTVGLVISPYTRKLGVDSTLYTTASMVHTIELILNLPPMTQYDTAATPMLKCFTGEPMLLTYDNQKPLIDLNAKNPTTGKGAKASADLDFSDIDRADAEIFNRILWEDFNSKDPEPAPVRGVVMLK